MKPVTQIRSRTVVLPMENVDTDQIIPARFLVTTSRDGLGKGLFADWRFDAEGTPKADFVLIRPEAPGARVLVAGRNFGCGSSREHAVWALREWGIRAIIAPSFGAILQGNCVRNGIVPVVLENSVVETLARQVESDPAKNLLTVDLVACEVRAGANAYAFTIAPADREMLLEGLDAIAMTMKRDDEILAWQSLTP